ncbi:Transmembrane domain-containing protein [Spironucleus salmonicida]|uniref:Transmembrane domain-containing protein n=1 Tax=Spironucleus salmonicida TaxID=348837 RepID=A0A9P8LS26_9EUKA|nr:Transmembrane domain-containing protein [Spironucleus salmonicida]
MQFSLNILYIRTVMFCYFLQMTVYQEEEKVLTPIIQEPVIITNADTDLQKKKQSTNNVFHLLIQVCNLCGTFCILAQAIITILRSIDNIKSDQLQFLDIQTLIISFLVCIIEFIIFLVLISKGKFHKKTNTFIYFYQEYSLLHHSLAYVFFYSRTLRSISQGKQKWDTQQILQYLQQYLIIYDNYRLDFQSSILCYLLCWSYLLEKRMQTCQERRQRFISQQILQHRILAGYQVNFINITYFLFLSEVYIHHQYIPNSQF